MTRRDVAAAALLPCENRCEKKSPQMYDRGKHVQVVVFFFFGSTFSLKFSFMLVMIVIVDVSLCRALMYAIFALEPQGKLDVLCCKGIFRWDVSQVLPS